MLSIYYDFLAFPILPNMLYKRENYTCEERILFIKPFLEQFNKECIEAVIADRTRYYNKKFLLATA